MIRITQLKLPIDHKKQDISKKAAKLLRIPENQIEEIQIIRQSLDARHKKDLLFVYTIDLSVKKEAAVVKKVRNKNITRIEPRSYSFPKPGTEPLTHRPVIVGAGPAGLFCAYMLAKSGYRPLLLERGEAVEERQKMVDAFWETGKLNPESNVQFGEGGAGTFSDGKLNTLIKDTEGRGRAVMEILVSMGAPEEILYQQKPHLGTDVLFHVVRNLRKQIEKFGGEVRFRSKVTDVNITDGHITSVIVNNKEEIPAEAVVLALGHSARDTFFMLAEKKIAMEAKSFAVGVRMEHPQKMINLSQYGQEEVKQLGAASYKLTHQTKSGRGVYTFCMCPGGYVVNASSEEGRLAVNGMSYRKRDSENANSAVIVTVTPEDYAAFGGADVPEQLKGILFQRDLEEKAFQAGKGRIPVQIYGDYKKNRTTESLGEWKPCMKGGYTCANVRSILPDFIGDTIEEGIEAFAEKIPGYNRPDALISGVESRSSSPVRIVRNEYGVSENTAGIYPCGEGAGYAGGITSAAIDGVKTAELIAKKYINL